MLQFEIVLISNLLYLIFKYFRNHLLITNFHLQKYSQGKHVSIIVFLKHLCRKKSTGQLLPVKEASLMKLFATELRPTSGKCGKKKIYTYNRIKKMTLDSWDV